MASGLLSGRRLCRSLPSNDKKTTHHTQGYSRNEFLQLRFALLTGLVVVNLIGSSPKTVISIPPVAGDGRSSGKWQR
jgi:hypothetical protein